MKTFLKLVSVALLFAQPLFAIPLPNTNAPDGGATAVLTLIAVSGLFVGKNFIKK